VFARAIHPGSQHDPARDEPPALSSPRSPEAAIHGRGFNQKHASFVFRLGLVSNAHISWNFLPFRMLRITRISALK
jgi:hypothetical protein